MDNQLLAFVKFGEEKYMTDLLKNGTLYINTVNKFKKIDDQFRGDKNEGASDILQSEHARLEMTLPDGNKITLDKNTGLINQIIMSNNDYTNTNIYSLYMIKPQEDFKVDSKMFQFGESALIIKEPLVFIDRITKALDEKKLPAYFSSVKYVDKSDFEGELSIFNKFKDYEYQNEYRIHVINTKDEPIFLKLGSLEDIGVIIPSAVFKEMKVKKI